MNRRIGAFGLMLAASLASPNPALAQQGSDSCISCHEMLAGRLGEPVATFSEGVHAAAGFGCVACHGGDPTVQGPEAMDEAKGYIGRPSPAQVPEICGRCHSDAGFMRQYNPGLRVDQVAEYVTSVHGQRLLGAGRHGRRDVCQLSWGARHSASLGPPFRGTPAQRGGHV